MKNLFFVWFVFVGIYCRSQTVMTNEEWKLYKPKGDSKEIAAFIKSADRITKNTRGKTSVIADDRISQLVERHVFINDSLSIINGYRTQLFSISGVNSKTKAEEVKANFIRLYPEYTVRLDFFSPNFKVRAGAFRTKLEALHFQNMIHENFPDCYVVSDNINLSELEKK